MINPETEQVITINEAKKLRLFRINGQSPDRTTVWRWIQRGRASATGERIKLETIFTPRGKATSVEACGRFMASLSGVSTLAAVEKPPANVARSNRLAAAGLI